MARNRVDVIANIGNLNILRQQRDGNIHANRFIPYPSQVVDLPDEEEDPLGLGLIRDQSILVKLERGQGPHQVNLMPEPAAFTALQHHSALQYHESGILGFFIAKDSAIKIQYRFNDAPNVCSTEFYNSHCVLLRPLTPTGNEIFLGDVNGPNCHTGWVFLSDRFIADYQNGNLVNDATGTRLQRLFYIAEFFVNAIFDHTIRPINYAQGIRTTGTMPNIFNGDTERSKVSTLPLMQFVQHCHGGFGLDEGITHRFFRHTRGAGRYPPQFQTFFRDS